MFRITAAALATSALIAGSAGTAQADIGVPTANVAAMATSIQSKMNTRAFGWQFAIAQDGKFVTSGKGGTALSSADTGGASVAMQPTMKMELASATKTTTAVATMKLLRANKLTVESSITPYLPSGWQRGTGFNAQQDIKTQVKFRHLLTHTSGISQAMGGMNPTPTNDWDGIQSIVANGTQVDSARTYRNANYVLLAILNAELWTRSGGLQTVTYEEEVYNYKGAVVGHKTITEGVSVSEETYLNYITDHLRKRVFEPIGLKNITCTSTSPATDVKSYPAAATQASKGKLFSGAGCAGHMGVRFSAQEHVQFLAHLRHGALLDPADRAWMDELRAGWWETSNTVGRIGAFFHPGDLYDGALELHTCGMTFTDGTEASLLVNSPIVGTQACRVLLDAWNAAK